MNINIAFSHGSETLRNEIQTKSIESYKRFSSAERVKRKMRYSTAGLGLLGIGGLLYYSWRSEAAHATNISTTAFKELEAAFAEFKHKQDLQAAPPAPAAPALTWSAAAKKYAISGLKNSFSSLTAIGTAMVVMGIQGYGASLFAKGILNPVAEKLIGIYSIHRFVAINTKLSQNTKDLICILNSLHKEEDEDNEMHLNRFELIFRLIEKDIINTIGFMIYIFSLVQHTDSLISSKAKADIHQAVKALVDLHALKSRGSTVDNYKKVLSNLVELFESFAVIGDEAGTDYLEDYYGSTFDQVRQAINADAPAPMNGVSDAHDLQQMLLGLAEQMGNPEAQMGLN